jgi:hypothetical protein
LDLRTEKKEIVLTAPSEKNDTYKLARLDTVEHIVRRQFEYDVRDVKDYLRL